MNLLNLYLSLSHTHAHSTTRAVLSRGLDQTDVRQKGRGVRPAGREGPQAGALFLPAHPEFRPCEDASDDVAVVPGGNNTELQ